MTSQEIDIDHMIINMLTEIRQKLDEIQLIMESRSLKHRALIDLAKEPETLSSSIQPSAPPRKWYVVFKGRIPGVYNTWIEAEHQVSGFKGNLHQAFDNEQEAWGIFRHFISTNQG